MKIKNSKIIKIIILAVIILLSTQTAIFAHSGRTDSSGGHKDNKNASGLGSYHYHCGGHPAHLHENGVCPYTSSSTSTSTSNSKKSTSSSSSSTSKSTETTSSESKTISVTSIKIENKNVATLEKGKTLNLTATIEPTDATNKNITWSSSDSNIATIDSTGKVSAILEGTVTLTAKSDNGKEDSIELKIEKPIIKVQSITLDETDISLKQGDSYRIIAVANPTDAENKNITWKSSNSNVAEVNGGKITAISAGTATISAVSDNGVSAICKVNVESNKSSENNNSSNIGGAVLGTAAIAGGGVAINSARKKKK